jgi:predicted nucleic acid-binding protein
VRLYVDNSALLKTIKRERETESLLSALSAPDVALISSRLVETELLRSVQTYALPLVAAHERLHQVDMVEVTAAQLRHAGLLPHPSGGRVLRTLDALHVVAALESDADAFVTYDKNQAAAAREAGLVVLAPGDPQDIPEGTT